MKRYLGLDIGTTSLKAAVFDEAGKRLGLRRVDYTLDTDAEAGYIEFDPESYVTMCKSVIDELSLECGEIAALSIDTQGETLILADEEGRPAARQEQTVLSASASQGALPHLDARYL